MIKVLELFSGTGSVGKCCKELGWDVVSVDLLLPADHEVDIMDFDYKQYPQDTFDIIWASPPCTEYSNLKNCWLGRPDKNGVILTKELLEEKRKESDKLIAKTLEIINYFKCELWFMENPQRGQLKDREIVKDIPFYDVSYCMYSDWGYEKRTRIWTNKKDWNNLICDKSGACGNMVEIPTNGALRHDTGKPLKCDTRILHKNNCGKTETLQKLRKLHKNNCGNTEKLQAVRQHKKVLGNGYEIIDGKKTVCNTKEKRDQIRKHKLNVSKDIHTVGENKSKHKKDVSVNFGSGTNRLDRYRIPPDLIYSLFLD